MSRETVRHRARVLSASIMFVTVLCFSRPVDCQNEKDFENPAFDEAAAGQTAAKYQDVVQKSLATITAALKGEIKEQLGFCIIDAEDDWNQSFDFSKNTDFLYECARLTKGDMTLRLCTAAEIKFYIHTFTDALSGAHGQGSKKKSQFVKPNTNCNLTSWVPGCEPGWACSVDSAIVNMENSKEIPARTANCASCCEGFFCPKGLTCMIPCPLGSYCPLAKLNNKTGLCDPYAYQIPPGKLNHTCGGADAWADIQSSSEVFCTAGSYCPSTIQKIPCSSGHYCRLGSTSQKVEQNGRAKGGNEVGIWKLYDGFVYKQVIFSICCPSITFNGHGVVGRIKHNECWWLATCEPRSANQNIRAYGILLFVGLSVLIVIIYGCSDQVLVIREKRKAKSREMAVQSVRENALAREKWKSAKDLARKGAIGLQTQLSRTFSRRKSSRQPETLRSSSQAKPGMDGLPPLPVGSQSQPPSKGNKQEESNLTKMMHEIENNPESPDGFNVEIGDKSIRKQTPKGKQLHTQSQMFRYAYGQIEKEKAMQEQTKNMTFSGVISMANEIEIRKRPTIEVAFKDLTITLKGKNKHLMRSVTGKLSPGRVSAVMGPSGAGKTTFLSALKGRVPGCIMSGTILVNGKVASIQSYKRIIGFVPQDDIVHGNLTVEENLWFSARCRLSADLPKAEKVLVVERVIESLGLQHIRDSLVGTVEKRGVSGGQRKRVNVGLEMVMEPSLLILDEPTSGLDSSSSQLLLRALRREALEGVNICTVVHQPSYALFRMFDDLILLAKGGVIVYHGPVKKVEEYFASLGITVPDRINPPDYFIDILEGIVKPSSSSGFDYKELPVRWMLHNGYSVPMDMLQSIEGMSASVAEHLSQEINDDSSEVQSFAGEFWQDIKCNAAHRKDSIQRNFLNLGDLSKRRTPGVFVQYRYFLGRVGKQRLREAKIQVVDYLILLLAGICIGTLAKVSDENFGATGYTHTVIAVSLLCKIAALRSFSLDKLHYWRESASGMSSLAFFLSKDTVDHFNTLIKPLVYLSMFYFFNNPRSSVTDNYLVLACLVYCVTGIAYIMAICFEPGPAQLWSVLLPVVLTLIATNNDNNRFVERISDLSYTKWALEAFVVSNAKRYRGVWLITRCGALYSKGYDLNDFFPGLMRLILAGILSRTIAFFCMITLQKN